MIDDPGRLAAAGAALLEGELAHHIAVAGGDLSCVVRIGLRDGRTAIVKGGPSPAVEADMLMAIRAACAPAPAVFACDESALVIEQLPDEAGLDMAWGDLGRVLSRLHGATGARYGWPADYAFGAVAIDNSRTDDWAQFWAERRLLNQLPFVSQDLARRISTLSGELPDRLPRHPEASLLHGDLWGGNVLTAGDRITGLIDPACYYGDAEVDFAMLELFGRPTRDLFDSYGPLPAGAGERRPIYQLWPALVHLRLFGAGYRGMVERLLKQAGA